MRCRMLNKKVLNFLLNVKHTVVDDVKIFGLIIRMCGIENCFKAA